jgi:hypothetical protein
MAITLVVTMEERAAIVAGVVTMGAADSPGVQRRQVIFLGTAMAVRYVLLSSGRCLPLACTYMSISVRFEVFTAVSMKNCVFWDVTPCGSCKNRRFGGT